MRTIAVAALLTLVAPLAFAAAGDPVPDVDVSLDKPGGIVIKVPLKPDGSFLLTGLQPGKYLLRAKSNQGIVIGQGGDAIALTVSASPAVLAQARMAPTPPQQISAAQLKSGFQTEVQVAADGTLAGRFQRVEMRRLQPPPRGAMVTVEGQLPEFASSPLTLVNAGGLQLAQGTAAADGKFSLSAERFANPAKLCKQTRCVALGTLPVGNVKCVVSKLDQAPRCSSL